MLTWYPDFCPSGQCRVELVKEVISSVNPKAGQVGTRTGAMTTFHDDGSSTVEYIDYEYIEPDFLVTTTIHWDVPKSIIELCPHHQSVKNTHGHNDKGIFEVILQSSRVKESARWAAKLALALDKEHPGVPYRVEPDGSFALGMDKNGLKMLEWPTKKADKDKLQADVDASVLPITKPNGTSAVRIA